MYVHMYGHHTRQCMHLMYAHRSTALGTGHRHIVCLATAHGKQRHTYVEIERETRDLATRCQLWANCPLLTRHRCQIPPTFTVRETIEF